MFVILCRVLIIYFVVLLYLRIMGKRQLGEMQPFELVITLLMADIASLPMTQTSMPVLFGIIPLTMLVVVHFFVCLLSRKSLFFRRVFNGKPVIVVSPQGIQLNALKELNMSIDDLMEGVRACNYFSLEEVLYAIVETNGVITVIPKKDASNVTINDLNLKLPENTLPLILVSSGKVVNSNLKIANIDKTFVDDILNKCKIDNLKDVLLLTIDTTGQVFLEAKNGQIQNLKVDFGGKW